MNYRFVTIAKKLCEARLIQEQECEGCSRCGNTKLRTVIKNAKRETNVKIHTDIALIQFIREVHAPLHALKLLK